MPKGQRTQTSTPVRIGDGDAGESSLKLSSVNKGPCKEEISGYKSKTTPQKFISGKQLSFKDQAS